MKFIARSYKILYFSQNVVTVITYRKIIYVVHVAGMVMRDIHSGGLVKKGTRRQLENIDINCR